MADNAKSRRKRARNNRKKNQQLAEVIVEEIGESLEREYRVESPQRIKSPEPKKPIKSRSLDDDDVKIQELSEVSESEDKSECKAIISEAESDVEWEITSGIDKPEVAISTVSLLELPLEQYKTEEVSLMSPEEELTLRNFLESLNLVNSPEDAFKQIRNAEVSTMESVKFRRAKKRAVLEQYFSPLAQNPRFLDVISEEASDLSDRECKSLTHHLKQGTPEPEVPHSKPPKAPPRKIIRNPAILVGTKIIEVPSVTHDISTSMVPQSKAEVVYLEDSSNSTTPDPKSDNEDEKDTNDDLLSSTHSSVADLRESETIEESKQFKFVVKNNDSQNLETDKYGVKNVINVKCEFVPIVTPPPTPELTTEKILTLKEIKSDSHIEDQSASILEAFDQKDNISEEAVSQDEAQVIFYDLDSSANNKFKLEYNAKEKELLESQTNAHIICANTNLSSFTSSTNLVKSEIKNKKPVEIKSENESSIKALETYEVPKEQIIDITVEKNYKIAQNEISDKNEASGFHNISKIPEYTKEKIIDIVDNAQKNFDYIKFVENSKNLKTPKLSFKNAQVPQGKIEEDSTNKFKNISSFPNRTNEKIITVDVKNNDKSETQDNILRNNVEVDPKNSENSKDRFIEIKLEDNFGQNAAKTSSSSPKSTKETILKVDVEDGYQRDEQTNLESESLMRNVNIVKTPTFLSTELEKQCTSTQKKIIKEFGSNCETNKENILDVKTETGKNANLENFPSCSKATNERIIKVNVKDGYKFDKHKEMKSDNFTKNVNIVETPLFLSTEVEKQCNSTQKEIVKEFGSGSNLNTKKPKERILEVKIEAEPSKNIESFSSNPQSSNETIIKVNVDNDYNSIKRKENQSENNTRNVNIIEASSYLSTESGKQYKSTQNKTGCDYKPQKLQSSKEKIIKVQVEEDLAKNILKNATLEAATPIETIINVNLEDHNKTENHKELQSENSTRKVNNIIDTFSSISTNLEKQYQSTEQEIVNEFGRCCKTHETKNPKEKIIKVEIEDNSAKNIPKNLNLEAATSNVKSPKEIFIKVNVEDHKSEKHKEIQSENLITNINIINSLLSISTDLNKEKTGKERIIKVNVDNSSKYVKSEEAKENNADMIKTFNLLSSDIEKQYKLTQKDFCSNCNTKKIMKLENNLPNPKSSKETVIKVNLEDSYKCDQQQVKLENFIKELGTNSVSNSNFLRQSETESVTQKETSSQSSDISKKKTNPKSLKENIIKINIEDGCKSCQHNETKTEKNIKNFEISKSEDLKIIKLDDLTPPIVVLPENVKNHTIRLEPEWKTFTSKRENKKANETNIEIVTTEKLEMSECQESTTTSGQNQNLGKNPTKHEKCCEFKEHLDKTSNVAEISNLKSILEQENNSLSSEQYCSKETKNSEAQPITESPSKEVESICSLKRPESLFYSNVLSPPAPSPSPSLSSGSSRATSLCTTKFNSLNSPIADIEDFLKNKQESPLTLRELCVNFLMSQPFGADILQELADVSSSIENLTNNLISNEPNVMEKKKNENWGGLPTEQDQSLLVSLSPTQKSQLDKSRKLPDEASKLLDLHEKRIYRTTYHDERQVKNEIATIKPRLLAIIRDAQEPKIIKFSTLPRNMESARLKAKDLSEWLELARNKTRSEWNLTSENNPKVEIAQRRKSLPQELYERQMQYLQEKEKEIQEELEMLEEEKLRLELAPKFCLEDYHISKKGDFAENKKSRPLSMPVSTEFFRQQMYEEYMDEIAAREERKQHKVIKVSQIDSNQPSTKPTTGIESEFLEKVKQKQKLGKLNPGDELPTDTETEKIPKHLQEFMELTSDGVWSPGQKPNSKPEEFPRSQTNEKDEPISPIWTPKSATSSPTVERKEFRPVKFESPVLSRKSYKKSEEVDSSDSSKEPPWKAPETSSETGVILSTTLEKRLPTSHSSPASGFGDFSTRLPKAQNPTITLLQKAREGQISKGAIYIEDQSQNSKKPQHAKPPFVGPGEILYKIKNEYTSESDSEKPRKMADLGPRKFEGIGPTTKDGMPLILRSEVKDANQSKWYKKMYDTIHKQKPHRDEYVTVRYRQKRGQYPYTSGYLSEPEPGAYDSDFTDYKYATLDRRRTVKDKENDYVMSSTMPRNQPENATKHGLDPYKNQPGRIENYIPGHSSISEKEAKEWWDEVMDIFDGHLEQQKRAPQTKSFINQALKESGYESDSTLVFRRRDDTAQQLSPLEQKEVYKTVQKGGDIPLYGLRKPAPERPKEPEPPVPPPKGHHGIRNLRPESPRKYVENEVTIHYKTPVRQEIKEYLSEDELAYRQAEAMKKIYQEERRRKYLQVSKSLQELQDMTNRRHTDNFIPSQKSPIPLNRYDDFEDLAPPVKPRPRSPEPRLMARALYNFVGQTARELTFRKGDLIYVRRQVDKNWYEGELNAMVGLFPVNYVEIVTYDTAKTTTRKSHEGQARAKYNFVAQTHLELSLAKGELVVITRRVDDNWFEGKIGGRKGIFPVSYVEVLIDPSDPPPPSSKPVASPAAHSLLLNGSAGGKDSMGSHSYTPSLSSSQLTSSYHAKPVQVTGSYGSLNKGKNPVNQALHIETHSEPVPYRALYKYLPQNDDELELFEGDTVFVLEKCDDGWYVGSSERTGAFGTFPGNYVEKI